MKQQIVDLWRLGRRPVGVDPAIPELNQESGAGVASAPTKEGAPLIRGAASTVSETRAGADDARRQKEFAAARNANCKAVLAGIDSACWQRLRAHWEDKDAKHYHENYLKYFDLERWCPQAVVVAMQAGLTEGPRRRVLDIGCGSGLLLRVCKHFGHDVVGIDVGNPMFMAMCEALEVRCVADMILPGKRLPAELQGFDVITAVSPKFYRGEVIPGRPLDNVWDDEAWDFFLADLASRLHEDGFFFGKFNHNHELSPRMLERATRRQFVTEPGLRFVLPRGELT